MPSDVTSLLLDWSRGDKRALDALFPLVYATLREIAALRLRSERPGHTLQPTALVNEAYLRLVDQRRTEWRDRAHFFAVSAEIMRRVLVDHARKRTAEKRGSGIEPVAIDTVEHELAWPAEHHEVELIALDDALSALEEMDPQQAKVVELRFFAGLNVEETAAALDISERTVKREWRMARAWLLTRMAS